MSARIGWSDTCTDCGGPRRNELVLVDERTLERLSEDGAIEQRKRDELWITVFAALLIVAIFVIWGLVVSRARGRALPAASAVRLA